MKKLITLFKIGILSSVFILALNQVSFAENWTRKKIIQTIISESQKSKFVRPEIALAVAEVESGFRPDPISPKGAIGVMQIMPLTAKSVFNVPRYKLFDPEINIRLGVKFLDQLIEQYHGEIHYALSHYNGGSRVGSFPNSRIIPATRSYVQKVHIAAKRHQKSLASLKTPIWQKKNIFPPSRNFSGTNKGLKASLKEAEYWLEKAKLSNKSGRNYLVKNRFELTHLHNKMQNNRRVFRDFLKNG